MRICTQNKPISLFLISLLATVGCDEPDLGTTTPQVTEPKAAQLENIEIEAEPPDLPDSFTDQVLGYQEKQVPFEMVLIPGDSSKEIKPFYIGKTEVSREMFLRWSYGDDLDDYKTFYEQQKKDLRPSVIYGEHIALRIARDRPDWQKIPALGMSWLTARAYCIWLSEQTGKTYRLPTDEEWLHVVKLSGGVPEERAGLLAQARLHENTEEDVFGYPQPRRADEGNPNKLGLINLLGNATEWVQPTDEGKWVRGGHFALKAEKLTSDWRAIENNEVWNEHYPNFPRSKYWHLDFYYTGLRLVCEADSVEQ